MRLLRLAVDLRWLFQNSSAMDFYRKGWWHECTGSEFIQVFCVGKNREHFAKAIQDIFDFAATKGATGVLVGGSFVTNSKQPKDLDCVLIFSEEGQIPDRTERLQIEGTKLDVFFCAQTQPRILSSFVRLFSKTRSGQGVGTIHVNPLDGDGGALWTIVQDVDDDTLEIVKRVHLNRHVVDRRTGQKLIDYSAWDQSYGEWNAEVARISLAVMVGFLRHSRMAILN